MNMFSAQSVMKRLAPLWLSLFALCSNAAASPINGVYALGNPGQPMPQAVLENRNVDGIALRYFWSALEPRDGVFNWSKLDSDIAEATTHGKKVSLSVLPGVATPPWVYEAGAAQFSFFWTQSWGERPCARISIPIPWDPIYLSKWEGFVRELGRRYNRDPTLAIIKITGINSEAAELILPRFGGPGRFTGWGRIGCPGSDDVANWQRAGYTRAKIERAWENIADVFAHSFPDKQLDFMVVPRGLPSIDSLGNVIPHANGDAIAVQDLMSWGIKRFGKRFILQNNGLSAFSDMDELAALSTRTTVGHQMLWSVTADPHCRMNNRVAPCNPGEVLEKAINRGINGNASFLEIYTKDIANPDLENQIKSAHLALALNGSRR